MLKVYNPSGVAKLLIRVTGEKQQHTRLMFSHRRRLQTESAVPDKRLLGKIGFVSHRLRRVHFLSLHDFLAYFKVCKH